MPENFAAASSFGNHRSSSKCKIWPKVNKHLIVRSLMNKAEPGAIRNTLGIRRRLKNNMVGRMVGAAIGQGEGMLILRAALKERERFREAI